MSPVQKLHSVIGRAITIYGSCCLLNCNVQNTEDDNEGGSMMKDLYKILLIGLIVMYVVSPVDACPGPIDDIIVMLLGTVASRKLSET